QTPILDRLAPLPHPHPEVPRLRSRLIMVITTAVVVATLFALVLWQQPRLRSLWRLAIIDFAQEFPAGLTARAIVVLTASAGLLACAMVAIHELGHVIAGIFAGFRFDSMRIGPLQINRKLDISRYRGPGAWIRGTATMVPMKSDRLNLRGAAMVLG